MRGNSEYGTVYFVPGSRRSRITRVQFFCTVKLCERPIELKGIHKKRFCLNFRDPSLGTPHVEILADSHIPIGG